MRIAKEQQNNFSQSNGYAMYKMHTLMTHFFEVSCSLARRSYAFLGKASVLPFLFTMDRICSFFGHRDVFVDLRDEIENAAKIAISEYGVNTFYVGDRGEFDRQSVSAICSLKHEYPNIKLILVLPYFTNKLNTYKEYYQQQYDEIVIPSVLDDVHPKGAITRRNRWMVEQSSCVISYINRDHGGAYSTVRYADKKNLPIINLGSFNN